MISFAFGEENNQLKVNELGSYNDGFITIGCNSIT